MNGPLRVHPHNPRYFTDDTGQAIYLTGSHTWASLQDIGLENTPPFPYAEYLDFMQSAYHNFMRLWMFEQPERACWTDERLLFTPLPWARPGPGLAADGLPRFDLGSWNEDYFTRLRQRLVQAQERGIYAAVMLFQGWSLDVTQKSSDPWPFTGGISKDWREYPDWEPLRRAMGDTRLYAERVNLAAMTPRPELASTRYCLANPGTEYLVYLPEGGGVTLDLSDAEGAFSVEWFIPQLNRKLAGSRPLAGGDYASTVAPFTGDAVLYLRKMA